MEQKKLKGIKTYNIDVDDELYIYQAYASAVNWMLGDKMLSSIELEILSYFLYYNNKYKNIDDMETRSEFLFSSSTKKKIRDQFGINSQKFDNYLNKIKKKGVIVEDKIMDMFVIYPDTMSSLLFNFSVNRPQAPVKLERVEDYKFDHLPIDPIDVPKRTIEDQYELNNITEVDKDRFITLDDMQPGVI
jgi:hypothetical protein